MKIGFVLDDSLDKADGVQQYVLSLGKWFRSKGHEVHYLVGHTERNDVANIHSLSRNLQVHFNQNRMSTPLPAAKRPIRELLAQEDFDILHVQLPCSPFLAGRIIKAAPPRTGIVGTFHVIPFSGLERFATRLLGLTLGKSLKRFDSVYSVSRPAAEFALSSFGLRTKVLPNVVDLASFHAAKAFPRLSDGLVNIVFLGRLVERKGCLQLLLALEVLHNQKQLDGVRVLICGKGPLLGKLQNFVNINHLGRVVSFVGFVSEADKARYLKTAQLAVFPSTGGESFGIVLIEAMAAGSEVVIGGNNIGYRAVLGDRPGQLVDPNNPVAFAKTLHHFIANARARRNAKQWQDRQIHLYDTHTVGPQWLEQYQKALQKRA